MIFKLLNVGVGLLLIKNFITEVTEISAVSLLEEGITNLDERTLSSCVYISLKAMDVTFFTTIGYGVTKGYQTFSKVLYDANNTVEKLNSMDEFLASGRANSYKPPLDKLNEEGSSASKSSEDNNHKIQDE